MCINNKRTQKNSIDNGYVCHKFIKRQHHQTGKILPESLGNTEKGNVATDIFPMNHCCAPELRGSVHRK